MRLVAVCICAAGCFQALAQQPADQPETVMITLRAKPGAETELARVLEAHWRTVQELQLVLATPHVTLRGSDTSGKTYFVEILTWRDARIPDAAPAEVQKIWNQMNSLVEARAGRPGLEFVPMSVMTP